MSVRVTIGPSSFAASIDAPRRLLEEKGVEIVPNPFGRRLSENEIIQALKDVDGLIAGLEPLNRRVLSSARPRLRAIARVGIGMTNVDQEAARELGIKVSSTPDAPAQAVAELTLTAMLTLCRRLIPMNANFHRGGWPKEIGIGLIDTPVLLIGYGRIGRRVGEMLRPFGARLLVCDPLISDDSLTNGERRVSLEEGLSEAQIISLHASGDQAILGPAEFAQMHEGAFLLNPARGELVDEEALLQALENRKLGGAWLDAFREEPYNGPLMAFDEVLLTPHAGTYTVQCRLMMEMQAVENLLCDLEIL